MERGGGLETWPGSSLGGGPATPEEAMSSKVREREKTHMSASCRSGRSCAGIVDCAAAAARKGAAKNVLEEAMGGPAAWRTGPPPPC